VIKAPGLQLQEPGFKPGHAGPRCEHDLLTFILAPTAPTSLRLRMSAKQGGHVPE